MLSPGEEVQLGELSPAQYSVWRRCSFVRGDVQELMKRFQGYHVGVCHIHTKYSLYSLESDFKHILANAEARWIDCSLEPETILQRLNYAGVTFAIITDHNTMLGYYEAKKIVERMKYDILLIPSVEVTTKYGDLLIYGIEFNEEEIHAFKELMNGNLMKITNARFVSLVKERLADLDTDELEIATSEQEILRFILDRVILPLGGYAVPAHPFDAKLPWNRRQAPLSYFHGFELFNGGAAYSTEDLFELWVRVHRLSSNLPILPISGSDAHFLRHLFEGVCVIKVGSKEIKNPDELLWLMAYGREEIVHLMPSRPWRKRRVEEFIGAAVNFFEGNERNIRKVLLSLKYFLLHMLREKRNVLQLVGLKR